MKIRIPFLAAAILFGVLPAVLLAQPAAHYVPGIEGIKGASLPPPGFYVRDYTVVYHSTRANDGSGNSAGPENFDALTCANVPRALWISDTKLLGGFVGVDGLLPLIYQSLNAGPMESHNFGIGDFFAESTLSWHLQKFDFSGGFGVWAPTGDSAAPPTTRTGAGFWTPMFTVGATWYVDAKKTWALSALNRYEFNTEQRDTHVTPGQAYTLEWGLSKTVAQGIDLGAVGYFQQQVTANSGAPSSSRSSVAAVGPEINLMIPNAKLFVSLRYNYEFMAESRAQGQTFALTLTKPF